MSTSSKFYAKSLTLMAHILELINEGIISSEIAKKMNVQKSHVSYYISKAKRMGLVKEVFRDTFKSFELTQPGKNFLDQYEKNNISLPRLRAENIQFRVEIVELPTIPVNWNRVEMHNWTQYTSEIDSVKVRLNLGNSPTLQLIPSPVDGDDPFDLLVSLVHECISVLQTLEYKTGLRVGKIQLASRGEWLVYDPLARMLCKYHGQVTYEGIGKVNASKPRHAGEFEFHDPRSLLDYLLMPQRLNKIERMLEQLLQKNPSPATSKSIDSIKHQT